MTTSKTRKNFDPTILNTDKHISWFDDFNEDEGEKPTNGYRFLSNFYVGEVFTLPNVIWDDGTEIEFKTGEHAFQAFKAFKDAEFAAIVAAPTPAKAKALGRSCELRPDWEAVKFDVMMAVLRAKFTWQRYEGKALVDTKQALLTEGTFWYDDTWGVMLNKQGRPGRNWLGTLLMARRAELVAEVLGSPQVDTGQYNVSWALESHE